MKKRSGPAAIFVFCIILNLMGSYLAWALKLPVWLNMTGSCVATYALGLPAGVAAALLNHLVFGIIDVSSWFYLLPSLIAVLLFYCFSQKRYPDRLSAALLPGFWTGAVCALVSALINLLVSEGSTHNLWGDAFIDMLLWYGANRTAAAILGELFLDLVDKQVCTLLACLILKLLAKRLTLRAGRNKQATALLLAIAVFAGALLPCGEASASAKESANYSSTIYNNLNGLISSEANTIVGTDDGYLWIGSYAGLTRYDGTTFEFIHTDHIAGVRALFCDSKGRLWIGTNDAGVFRYENGEFTQFTAKDGLPSDSIRCFYETQDGGMYVATTDRLCLFDAQDEITVPETDLTYVVSMTGYGENLVCVSKDGALYVVDAEGKLLANEADMAKQEFTCVQNTSRGLCAGTTQDGVLVLDVTEKSVGVAKRLSSSVKNSKRLLEDSDGRLWVCGDGLGYLDENNRYHAMNVENFDSSLEDLYQDYQGNLWVASSSYGVAKLVPTLFHNLFTQNGISAAACNAVAAYQGYQYCGTDSGLIILDEENGNQIENDLTAQIGEDRVRDLLVDTKGRLWICTYGENGLVCVDTDGSLTTYTEADGGMVPNDRIRCITQTGGDSFAVGTADGLFFVENGKAAALLTKEDGLETSQILCLYYDEESGYLYAGSDGGGIYVISGHELLKNLTTEQGLTSNVIMRFVPYQEQMLIVTSNSLCILRDRTENGAGEISALSEFPYFNNYDILLSGETAYVLSSAGLYVADIEQLVSGGELVYSLYGAKSGLISGITANAWNYVSEDGVLYFCCNDGVMTFDIGSVGTDETYRYGLTQILCDDTVQYVDSDVCQIPAETETVTLSASLRNYSLSDVKVKFFLEGEEEDTGLVSASEISDICMVKPAAGSYTVRFQIYDTSGSTLIDEKTYTLIKDRQTWEKPWFRAYLTLIGAETAVLLLGSLARLLESRRKRRELESFAKRLAEKVEEQRLLLVEESREKDEMMMNTVAALSGTVDAKDRYTSGHSSRVAGYARMLAARMGKSEAEQEKVYCAGLLHDVGKIRVPEAIINKPGKLTDEEYELIKLHPITGYHILKSISPDHNFADGARFHHERYDGKGYPNGLAGEAIPEIARIICVADAYDAMASNRSYRSAMSQEAVRAEIANGRGTQFDPHIADLMLQMIDEDRDYTMREAEYNKKKILILSSDIGNTALVNAALSDEKIYRLQSTASCDTALELLKQEEYDAILLDADFAGEDTDGQNLYRLVREIRRLCRTPVILMIADKISVRTEKEGPPEIDDFITKPFVPAVLKEIIHAVLLQ